MEQERLQVLEMVAVGRLTPQQGAELLEVLAAKQTRTNGGTEEPARGRERRAQRPRFSTTDLVQLGDHGVEARFIRQIGDLGLGALSVDELIDLHEHGVQTAFLREIDDLGYSDLRVNEIIELYEHGVDRELLQALVEASPAVEADHRA